MSSSGLIRWGGLAGLVGGPLWALTPLREPLLGGRFPEDPVFRPYNLALLVITVVLALGLWALRERYKGSYGRLGTAGVVMIFVGYALMFLGSVPAVVLSLEGWRGLIMAGQDLGFLGALVTGVGAILLGIALWRTPAAPTARCCSSPLFRSVFCACSSLALWGCLWTTRGFRLRSCTVALG